MAWYSIAAKTKKGGGGGGNRLIGSNEFKFLPFAREVT